MTPYSEVRCQVGSMNRCLRSVSPARGVLSLPSYVGFRSIISCFRMCFICSFIPTDTPRWALGRAQDRVGAGPGKAWEGLGRECPVGRHPRLFKVCWERHPLYQHIESRLCFPWKILVRVLEHLKQHKLSAFWILLIQCFLNAGEKLPRKPRGPVFLWRVVCGQYFKLFCPWLLDFYDLHFLRNYSFYPEFKSIKRKLQTFFRFWGECIFPGCTSSLFSTHATKYLHFLPLSVFLGKMYKIYQFCCLKKIF